MVIEIRTVVAYHGWGLTGSRIEGNYSSDINVPNPDWDIGYTNVYICQSPANCTF